MTELTVACPDVYKMCQEHFNEPVLMYFKLARLVGYGEDADDCYLIVKYPDYPDGKIVHHTAVGGYIFLDKLQGQHITIPAYPEYKGQVWDDYYRLDEALELNGARREKEFIVDKRPHETAKMVFSEIQDKTESNNGDMVE